MYNNRVEDFLTNIDNEPTTQSVDAPDEIFSKLFADFKLGANRKTISEVYAQSFYFNDTFKTITSIDELLVYMEEAASNVETTTVQILDVAKSDTDYYLRWVMHMQFTAKGRKIDSKSIGVTQLRFNQEGKIVFHQDYWDGAEGFYQHLPFVGYLVRKVRNML